MSEFSSPDLISAYADNQLSDQERQEVDALLERSPEARAELESYRKLGSLLKNLPEQQAGSDLARRVLAQAEQESLLGKSIPSSEINTTPDSTSNRRWAISMAAFLATAALLFLAITQFQPPRKSRITRCHERVFGRCFEICHRNGSVVRRKSDGRTVGSRSPLERGWPCRADGGSRSDQH